jgi:hypothetical protein
MNFFFRQEISVKTSGLVWRVEPDASFFSVSSHQEERVGERRPFGTPFSGSFHEP